FNDAKIDLRKGIRFVRADSQAILHPFFANSKCKR
ncbi:Ribosomal protein L24e-related protein, partial [Corchorus capsularis]